MELLNFYHESADLLRALRADLLDKARCTEGVDDFLVRDLIRALVYHEKNFRDERAKILGKMHPPKQTNGKRTNIGDPMPHGPSGGSGLRKRR